MGDVIFVVLATSVVVTATVVLIVEIIRAEISDRNKGGRSP